METGSATTVVGPPPVDARRRDRGDGPIGMVIGASVFVLGLVLTIDVGLGYYARLVLSGAAQEGAVEAARLGGSVAEDMAQTDALISGSSGSLLRSWSTRGRVETDGLGGRRVVIETSAVVAGPIGSWTLTATGSAPVERFRPQGG